MRRAASIAGLIMLVAGMAAPAQASVAYPSIIGSGSAASANLVAQWAGDFRQVGIPVSYNAVGSTAGRSDFRSGTVDFAVTELPYGVPDASAVVDPPPTREFAYVPLTAGGTALAFNLTINGQRVTDLRLTGEAVARIFTGQITEWDDPAIRLTNPGLVLPNSTIVPVVRSDGAASSYLFTQWLASEHSTVWNEYCASLGIPFTSQCLPTSYFPASDGFVSQAGSLGVSGFSQVSPGTITYVDVSNAMRSDLGVARVQNAAGAFVPPTDTAVSVALGGATVRPDLTADLTGVWRNPDPRAYPLSAYSYAVVPLAEGGTFRTDKGRSLGDFLAYALCEGQQAAPGLGYASLPAHLRAAGPEQVRRIPGAAVGPIDVSNCGALSPPRPEVFVSTRKDRSDPVALDGTTQRNRIYIFATPPAGLAVTSVDFYLDGSKVRTERNAPYDLNGGNVTIARAYNVTRELAPGCHQVLAVFLSTSGDVTTTADFAVGRAEVCSGPGISRLGGYRRAM